MATHAGEWRRSPTWRLLDLLKPPPGRLEFSIRLALLCALTVLVAEIYQTPEPALTAYVAFFVIKPDRTASIAVSVVMLLLITLVIGAVLLMTTVVIDRPLWRVATMVVISFCLLFAGSASKLKPIAGIVALIAAYALDLLGTAHMGEIATRALLYAWLFVGIPAAMCVVVNLVLGPTPRRLVERALAHRLRLCARMLRHPDAPTRAEFEECVREGLGEVPTWLMLAAAEKTSPAPDIAALRQAAQSTAVILTLIDVIVRDPATSSSFAFRPQVARTFDEMAAILGKGGYPVDIVLAEPDEEVAPSPGSAALQDELRTVLAGFAEPPPPEPSPQPVTKPAGGFFLPDAFTNPVHVHYALKTTAAAMFCYIVYTLLDWPGIHTCLITCYIVSLGTTAETVEKLTLRILGALFGAATGIAAIVFVMPDVTSIGALMIVVFVAGLVSAWIAAGSPRISYVGFQLAFAFFLCVVQGSAPAFDMTVARDRVIGIVFGNLVVAVIFTLIWPVSVAGRIDPAIAALLRQLAAMASANSRRKRWTLAAQSQTTLGSIEQDIRLTRYEPSSIRPAPGWLDRRRAVVDAISVLQGPLFLGVDQDPVGTAGVAPRLDRLADRFTVDPAAMPTSLENATASSEPVQGKGQEAANRSLVEVPLVNLEQTVARPWGDDRKEKAHNASA